MPDQLDTVPPRRSGRPRGSKSHKPPTNASLSRELKIMAMTSLGFVGGVKYLQRVAKTNPAAYLAFLAKTLVVKDDGGDTGERTFVVQTLNMIAMPTPGVINSPIAGHIAPVRLAANGGEVIDNEPGPRRGG